MVSYIQLFSLILILSFGTAIGQKKHAHGTGENRLSIEAEVNHSPCIDTINVLFWKTFADMDLLLPAWQPVVNHDTCTELEGLVTPRPNSEQIGTHVSPEDFPLLHYTHDFGFNVIPDSTQDHRFTNLLALQVFKRVNEGDTTHDTILKPYIHCEWETGLAADNAGNICATQNRKGESCGFFSAGHQRKDRIWQWPSIGDWVHVEGLWIWDRGHPPAGTEIHPCRLVATRRNLPAKIKTETGAKFATRIDIYANGDGGPFNNNRGIVKFAKPVRMSQKDYEFEVTHSLPRPSASSNMKFVIITNKGHTYPGDVQLTATVNANKMRLFIPWKNVTDTAIFAQTLYLYWDEGNGTSSSYPIESYKVTFDELRFKNRRDLMSRSELRVFIESAGEYIFLNEFIEVDDILKRGLGRYGKKRVPIHQEFIVHVPHEKQFRVHVGGWEADRINIEFGHLIDPESPCTIPLKRKIHKALTAVSPFMFGGCLDDFLGEINVMHKGSELSSGASFEAKSDGRVVEDICIPTHYKQFNALRLFYRIERLNGIN